MAFFVVNENGASSEVRKCTSNIEFSTRIKLNGNSTYRTDSPVSNVATYKSNRYKTLKSLISIFHTEHKTISLILRYFDDSDSSLNKTNLSDEAEIYVPPLAFDRNSTFSKEFLTYTNRKDDNHHNMLKDDHHHLRNTEAYKEWLGAKMYVFGLKVETDVSTLNVLVKQERMLSARN